MQFTLRRYSEDLIIAYILFTEQQVNKNISERISEHLITYFYSGQAKIYRSSPNIENLTHQYFDICIINILLN